MRFTARIAAAIAVIATAVAGGIVATAPPAQALSGSDFDPGYIISDELFYDGQAMTAAQIQSFLDAKIGACQNGKCLNVAVLPVANRAPVYSKDSGNLACTAITGGNISVAELIYRTQVACNISAKVILVTLQKEQGLVTSKAPTDGALRAAMGQGCPDSPGGCDSAFAGLAIQIMSGAGQLSKYKAALPVSTFHFKYPGVYNILYKPPSLLCPNPPAPPVNVRNFATLALYNYTPYQPNAAALANLDGYGDECSSYGNRNFWRFYNNWFGSSTIPAGTKAFITAAYADVLNRAPSESDMHFWVNGLLSGASRSDVAGGFNNSDEYRLMRIDEAYRTVLGREPEASGRAWWLAQMKAGLLQPDDARRNFYASQEFYTSSGGTDETYIDAIYQVLLGRGYDAGGLVFWSDVLATQGRSGVVDGIWFSAETYYFRVTQTYQSLLGRDPSTSDQAYWTEFARTQGHTAMRTRIMASPEYWNRASKRFPGLDE